MNPRYPRARIEVNVEAPDGNIFTVLDRARRALYYAGASKEDLEAFHREVTRARSYGEALTRVESWLTVKRVEPCRVCTREPRHPGCWKCLAGRCHCGSACPAS